MSDGHETVSKRYRELAREEPSAALDGAILAASRRAVAKPSFSRRWGVPVSIAAVLVLGFGVTLQMERDKPGVATSLPAPAPTSSAPAAAAQMAEPVEPPKKELSYAAKPEAARAAGSLRADVPVETKTQPLAKERAARDEMQAAPAVETQAAPAMELRAAPAQPASPPAAPAVSQAPARDSYNAAPAARGKSVLTSPEQELDRIAKLRSDGQDAEADRALEDFRRRYPDYRIADAMWERVKPR
jgi:resuscitation-promoting factor RpfA